MREKGTTGGPGRTAGFTLIELMIVVAVVAILAAIAYPSYQDGIRKSRRGQAKADLVELAQVMERFHTVNNTYLTPSEWTNPIPKSPREGVREDYTIAISNQSATTFSLTATPQGAQARDERCMTLTLDQAGGKDNSGPGELSDCW